MNHNQRLDGLLAQVREIAETAQEEGDFFPVFPLLRNFKQTAGPIKYDNTVKWWVFSAIAAVGAVFALMFFTNPGFQEELGDLGYVITGVFAIAMVITLVVIGTANSAIDEISDTIFRKDVYFDNKLVGVDIEGRRRGLYDQFHGEFGDFRSRGDEDRYVSRMVHGVWAGKEHSFEYDYYVFHYVEVWYETVNHYDSKGKYTHSTREKRTRTCYRRGLILELPVIKGFVAKSGGGSYDYPEGFQPVSEEFNNAFGVGAVSAHEAAKLLKPAVVLAFLELNKYFSGLNVEINRNGRMNIAFSDGNVLDLDRKFSIAEPDEFQEEIKSHLDLPKLRLLLEFIETLEKHNDSNF